uniref:Uncharacterized protein n=1 Tax=Rhizophora mucronata TaxID=61149 RepID=A0A2P2KGS9_RHIMU
MRNKYDRKAYIANDQENEGEIGKRNKIKPNGFFNIKDDNFFFFFLVNNGENNGKLRDLRRWVAFFQFVKC